jgi:hypothetical protein
MSWRLLLALFFLLAGCGDEPDLGPAPCERGTPGCPCAEDDSCETVGGRLHLCVDDACEVGECDGADLTVDMLNCGACDRACPDGALRCDAGQCWGPQISACFAVTDAVDCDAYCEAQGSFCNLGCWESSAVDFYDDATCSPGLYLWSNQCDSPLEESADPVAARCCCAEVIE